MSQSIKHNFKDIHIGELIKKAVDEKGLELLRICNFMKCEEEQIQQMYQAKTLEADIILRWSKILEYDFFRVYSQHLILYAPASNDSKERKTRKTSLPQFRKNIYTKEVIDFVLEQITKGKKTKAEIIEEYKIPKTTLYKWINKYK